ncbi:MAG: S46 family peptidase [Bacteroidetes bacterium]|nr:S46 family peptidase [Bacteroidota bacterium]
MKVFSLSITLLFLFSFADLSAQYNIYETFDPSDTEYSLDDFGTMWTFDNVPLDKWETEYGFRPTEQWLDNVRLSALQFGRGCSAAFVSGDGLIMTNHHCGRGQLSDVQKEGENLLRDGYIANTLEDERKIPGLFVDQLLSIEDVTDSVYAAMSRGENDDEKVSLRDSAIRGITDRIEKETGLTCNVIAFYNGGKYKAYTYKRYFDVRLVMAPDFQIAATGWDWDNFTYPRYELDFAFYRAYDENGQPVKSEHYFRWSKKGAEEGEEIFVIGRPGRTRRLISVAEMEYLRDYEYKYRLLQLNEVYKVYYELFNSRPESESELLNKVLGTGNGRKSYAGRLLGLRDEYIMSKKKDFERNLKNAVNNDPALSKKYGHVWDSIENALDELKANIAERTAFTLSPNNQPYYYNVADQIIKYAEQLKLPEDDRKADYHNGNAIKHLQGFYAEGFDHELNEKLLRAHINYICGVLGPDHWLVKKLFGEKRGEEAVADVLQKSFISSPEKIEMFSQKSADQILHSDDPFIYFLMSTRERITELDHIIMESRNTIQVLNQMLGEIVFAVHGEMLPPDATSSLRISDGRILGYEYNGTIAPAKTTFFGLYDRYYSFNQKTYPWGLHERWKNPPAKLNLATPIGYASTNDIVGGNSGSTMINKKGEVIGLVHDGNLESLAGDFIFIPENNRAVATDSYGLMEALKYIYKSHRLVKELEQGKIVE